MVLCLQCLSLPHQIDTPTIGVGNSVQRMAEVVKATSNAVSWDNNLSLSLSLSHYLSICLSISISIPIFISSSRALSLELSRADGDIWNDERWYVPKSTSIRHRSDAEVSGPCLNDVNPMVFALWVLAHPSIDPFWHTFVSLIQIKLNAKLSKDENAQRYSNAFFQHMLL